jgi:hypothetical protein
MTHAGLILLAFLLVTAGVVIIDIIRNPDAYRDDEDFR